MQRPDPDYLAVLDIHRSFRPARVTPLRPMVLSTVFSVTGLPVRLIRSFVFGLFFLSGIICLSSSIHIFTIPAATRYFPIRSAHAGQVATLQRDSKMGTFLLYIRA